MVNKFYNFERKKSEMLTLVALGYRNYIKPWGGGGRSALPLKTFQIWLKTHLFKVCHSLYYIKIIIVKISGVKEFSLLQWLTVIKEFSFATMVHRNEGIFFCRSGSP